MPAEFDREIQIAKTWAQYPEHTQGANGDRRDLAKAFLALVGRVAELETTVVDVDFTTVFEKIPKCEHGLPLRRDGSGGMLCVECQELSVGRLLAQVDAHRYLAIDPAAVAVSVAAADEPWLGRLLAAGLLESVAPDGPRYRVGKLRITASLQRIRNRAHVGGARGGEDLREWCREWRRGVLNQPCDHGEAGALHDPLLCSACAAEGPR